jgi:hypothetical protein
MFLTETDAFFQRFLHSAGCDFPAISAYCGLFAAGRHCPTRFCGFFTQFRQSA